jgi:hypothetical protein
LDQYYIAKARVTQAKNFEAAAPTRLWLNIKNIFLKHKSENGIIDLFDGKGKHRLPPITMVTQIV